MRKFKENRTGKFEQRWDGPSIWPVKNAIGRQHAIMAHRPGSAIRLGIVVLVYALIGVLLLNRPLYSQTIEPSVFGDDWGQMDLPVSAEIGAIDQSERLEIGLSAMQFDNIDWSGEYNAVWVRCRKKTIPTYVYNAFGIHAMEGFKVRISSALADELGCEVGEEIWIDGLATKETETNVDWMVEIAKGIMISFSGGILVLFYTQGRKFLPRRQKQKKAIREIIEKGIRAIRERNLPQGLAQLGVTQGQLRFASYERMRKGIDLILRHKDAEIEYDEEIELKGAFELIDFLRSQGQTQQIVDIPMDRYEDMIKLLQEISWLKLSEEG